jgi:subtilase family protein
MAVERGWVERYHDDQIVVALPDLRILAATLHQHGVHYHEPADTNPVLGLARLSGLTGIGHAVGELLHDPDIGALLSDYRDRRNAAHPGHPVSGLALLIRGIRLLFAHWYPGWQVTIGKNYHPSLVKGFPHIGGGDGEPTPVSQPFTAAVGEGPGHPDAGRGVRVGLADTRLYPDPRLAGHYLGRDSDLLPAGQAEFTEFDGHAAFVASCILQQAPGAELRLRPVLDENGDGSAWDVAVGLAELVTLNPDVVNLSLGEYMTDDDTAPMVLDAAVRRFSRDTVLVAAAGNNGSPSGQLPPGVTTRTASYPAALPDVIGVGALGPDGERAGFTPPDVPWISMLARGADVVGAYVTGKVAVGPEGGPDRIVEFSGTANWAGCSFAAGVVSGVVAARTVPGHRSAREALADLERSLAEQPRTGLRLYRPGPRPGPAGPLPTQAGS